MSVNTAANRFITTSLTGFYQQLLASRLGFREVAERLIKIAENAHAFREFNKVYEAGELLSNLPLKEYRNIGHFYIALSMCRNGLGDMERALVSLEKLVDVLPMRYRAKAMLLLAAINGAKRNPEQELYFFTESLKINPFNVQALRGIAVLKAKEGYHPRALKELEQLYPLARFAAPNIYFDYMNSLAVELGEAGRLEEAKNVSGLVVASPFAPHYPEYRETYSEINQRLPRRSVVKIGLPEPREHEEEYEPEPAANVVPFPRAKPYIPSTHLDTASLGEVDVTAIELLAIILRGVLKDRATDEEINKICNTFFFALKNLFDDE